MRLPDLTGVGVDERFSARVGIHVAVQHGTVAAAGEQVTGGGVVEAADDVPERPDTVGTGDHKAGRPAQFCGKGCVE